MSKVAYQLKITYCMLFKGEKKPKSRKLDPSVPVQKIV